MTSPLMATYDRIDIAFERGEGAYVYAADGRRFLDFGAGVAVTALGHCHPHLVKALQEQANALWHCSNWYRIPQQETLAQRLTEVSFADAVFFCNSGAEALECTIKLARKYQHDRGTPERYRIVTFEGAFHGRTLATIAAGGSAKHLAGFAPVMDGFDHVPLGDLSAVRAAVTDRTAAILIEPVQGEGGIRAVPVEFLTALRSLCDEFGILLCVDEVQSGMGRTGRLFAHEWAGIKPDIMALAKGLGGGFPVGACLAVSHVAKSFAPGTHGSTFGGNPLAMAVANAVLDVMLEDHFLAHVRSMGALLHQRLAHLPALFPGVVSEVRGLGLMIGLKCGIANTTLTQRLFEHGLLAIPAADNVARLLPPLTIGTDLIDEACGIIERSCGELTDRAA